MAELSLSTIPLSSLKISSSGFEQLQILVLYECTVYAEGRNNWINNGMFFFCCHEQSELYEVQRLYNEEEEKKKREKADMHLTPVVKTPSTQKSPLPPSPVAETLIYPVRIFFCVFMFILVTCIWVKLHKSYKDWLSCVKVWLHKQNFAGYKDSMWPHFKKRKECYHITTSSCTLFNLLSYVYSHKSPFHQ